MSSANNLQSRAHSRERIRKLFGNNQQLSDAHFAVLIESMLNRREDKFHGAWKEGRTYRKGDVVHHDRKMWEMVAEGEICADTTKPSEDEDAAYWKAFPDDDDWEMLAKENAMWANSLFHRVGIGGRELHGNLPQAQLDVRNVAHAQPPSENETFSQAGRWLLFPKWPNPKWPNNVESSSEQPLFTQPAIAQQTLLHYGSLSENAASHDNTLQTSALFTGLSLKEAIWSSNASNGFSFRHISIPLSESQALRSSATEGEIMMALRPHASSATLGLNESAPKALIDAIAPSIGHFQLLPHNAANPTLTLTNLQPLTHSQALTHSQIESETSHEVSHELLPYTSMAIAPAETHWNTNATEGFMFSQSELADSAPNSLVRIRQYPKTNQPQLGIGTDEPTAVLDVQANAHSVQLLPLEHFTDEACEPLTRPAIAIANHSAYLQSGLSEQTASYATNAAQGFLFRQSADAEEHPLPTLSTGRVQLALRENGRVGIGTEQPGAALDIVHEDHSGRFLFSLSEPEGETAPTAATYPVIAVENRHGTGCDTDDDTGRVQFTFGLHSHQSAFTTNAAHGFSFNSAHTPNSNPLTLSPHEQLVNILPNGIVTVMPDSDGQLGIGTGAPSASLDIQRRENAIQLLPLPSNSDTTIPAISLVSHDVSYNNTEQQPITYLNTGLAGPLAGWLTNAPAGFVFKQGYDGQHDGGIEADQARLQMAIAPDGRIGIGTATPEAALDVVNDYHSGRFVLSLSPTNQATDHPTLAILNEQSHCPGVEDALPTYLSLSPQPDEAIFLTDASNGFVFKMGHPAGSERNYLNTGRHGRTLFSLSPNGEAALSPSGNGQLSIGKPCTDYALDVDGLTQARGFYQSSDAEQRENQASLCATLPNALAVVEALRPITFEWANSARLSTSGKAARGPQLGLDLETLCEVCPQVVITDGDGHSAIAYQNLVPVLIQALNEHVMQTQRNQQYDETERRQLQDQITHLVDRVRIMLFFLMFFGTLTVALTISLSISSLVGGA